MAPGTPSAQVRVPVEDLISPPHRYSHYTTWRKSYPAAENLSGGRIIIRRRAWVGQKFEKKSHCAENCRTVPKMPYSIS